MTRSTILFKGSKMDVKIKRIKKSPVGDEALNLLPLPAKIRNYI
jgi:hypothetical protein